MKGKSWVDFTLAESINVSKFLGLDLQIFSYYTIGVRHLQPEIHDDVVWISGENDDVRSRLQLAVL